MTLCTYLFEIMNALLQTTHSPYLYCIAQSLHNDPYIYISRPCVPQFHHEPKTGNLENSKKTNKQLSTTFVCPHLLIKATQMTNTTTRTTDNNDGTTVTTVIKEKKLIIMRGISGSGKVSATKLFFPLFLTAWYLCDLPRSVKSRNLERVPCLRHCCENRTAFRRLSSSSTFSLQTTTSSTVKRASTSSTPLGWDVHMSGTRDVSRERCSDR